MNNTFYLLLPFFVFTAGSASAADDRESNGLPLLMKNQRPPEQTESARKQEKQEELLELCKKIKRIRQTYTLPQNSSQEKADNYKGNDPFPY